MTEARVTRTFTKPFQCGTHGSTEREWRSVDPTNPNNHGGQYVPGTYSWVPGKFATTLRKED